MNESQGDRLVAATKRLQDSRQAARDRAAELAKTVGPQRQEEANTGDGTNPGQ